MRRHALEVHRRKLGEIRDIMKSMKTLASMESHKLSRYVDSQGKMADSIREIAGDFLQFHPDLLPAVEPAFSLVLAVGSERGFCGDFNERVAAELNRKFCVNERKPARKIIVGSKLHPFFEEGVEQTVFLRGADIAEEITAVLDSLVETLAINEDTISLYLVYHDNDDGQVTTARLLPPFRDLPQADSLHPTPPVLNISARDFFFEMTDHFLFTRLQQILFLSLMAENQYRVQHLEHAVRHLDGSIEDLGRKINTLRQEEIIEEIEVILLNAAAD